MTRLTPCERSEGQVIHNIVNDRRATFIVIYVNSNDRANRQNRSKCCCWCGFIDCRRKSTPVPSLLSRFLTAFHRHSFGSVHNIFYYRSDKRSSVVSLRPHSMSQKQAADVRKSGLVLIAFDFLRFSRILKFFIMRNSLSEHHVFDRVGPSTQNRWSAAQDSVQLNRPKPSGTQQRTPADHLKSSRVSARRCERLRFRAVNH